MRVQAMKWIASVVTCAALAACGGGDSGPADLQLGVIVAGQPSTPVSFAQPVTVAMPAGQSIELDANEPVEWAFSVNGSPLFASGTVVVVQGVTITQQDLSPSRVVLATSFNGPTQLPIDVVMTATSTIDLAQVATVTVVIR